MITEGTDKKFADYISTSDEKWEYGNGVLYNMCKDNPLHNDEHVIVGKIWLIGRSYAAAIERRKNADVNNDDYYYDVVAPKVLSIGKELDLKLEKLNNSKGLIIDDIEDVLSTHKFLLDAFYDITGLEKRSLASKYLHFHCPDKFFIYDSRARSAINKLVKKPDKHMLAGLDSYDPEYADFVCRMLELQEYLDGVTGLLGSPRRMDSFLLSEVDA